VSMFYSFSKSVLKCICVHQTETCEFKVESTKTLKVGLDYIPVLPVFADARNNNTQALVTGML